MPVKTRNYIRKYKKGSLKKRFLAELGISRSTKGKTIVYVCIFLFLIVIYKLIMSFSSSYLF
jgi:hypothetical protein